MKLSNVCVTCQTKYKSPVNMSRRWTLSLHTPCQPQSRQWAIWEFNRTPKAPIHDSNAPHPPYNKKPTAVMPKITAPFLLARCRPSHVTPNSRTSHALPTNLHGPPKVRAHVAHRRQCSIHPKMIAHVTTENLPRPNASHQTLATFLKYRFTSFPPAKPTRYTTQRLPPVIVYFTSCTLHSIPTTHPVPELDGTLSKWAGGPFV